MSRKIPLEPISEHGPGPMPRSIFMHSQEFARRLDKGTACLIPYGCTVAIVRERMAPDTSGLSPGTEPPRDRLQLCTVWQTAAIDDSLPTDGLWDVVGFALDHAQMTKITHFRQRGDAERDVRNNQSGLTPR